MKVLVTGANGHLEHGIVKAILDRRMEVVATDFAKTRVDERAIRIDCNLFEVENPYVYFGKPDILLHLVWRDGFVHHSEAHIGDLQKHYSFYTENDRFWN